VARGGRAGSDRAYLTPLIFLLTEPEIRHVLADSGAAGIVTLAEHVEKVRAAALSLPDPPCVVMADDLGPLRS
jgi:long-chain acyl-CoA synthetase